MKTKILRIDLTSSQAIKKVDNVAEEKPLQLFLNRTFYISIFCSPSQLKELAVGHIISEGILHSLDEIDRVNLDESRSLCRVQLKSTVNLAMRLKLSKHFSRVIFSACGTAGTFQPTRGLEKVFSELKIEAEVIRNCVNSLNSSAKIFKKTGGVHAAAIYRKDGSLVGFAEDVGRHNAVDKVIGSCILRGNHFADCFLVLTGRLTGDIVMKAARTGIPIIASMAAAIDSGIAVAKRSRITLVGFVRGNRMNVYAFPDRILV